jgi:LacI family transcriptional regulator
MSRHRVALLIESSRAYGRGLLRGIAQYSRIRGDWSLYHQERNLASQAPRWLEQWSGDGIIARVETGELAELIRHKNLPTIDLRGRHHLPAMPLIETDDYQVVRLAMEHLLARSFENIAYCGFEGVNYSERRHQAFVRLVEQHAVTSFVYEGPPVGEAADTSDIESRGMLYEQRVGEWIASLPKPVGLVACNDIRAQQVLNACREVGVAVPEEVAVIGVDNDELICELCEPSLSSVEPDTQRIGFEAAAKLHQMMAGEAASFEMREIEPCRVVDRVSTDVQALADPEVAAAVQYIRERADQGINVQHLVQRASISRSLLERRFVNQLGRTPKAEIIRVRLERVKQLLRETDLSLERIAELTGFKYHEYMATLFRQKVGQTPGAYRAAALDQKAQHLASASRGNDTTAVQI